MREAVDEWLGLVYRKNTMKRTKATTPVQHPPKGIPAACCTLSISGADEERFVRLLKAAGNPLRFQILKFLVTHPGCITGDLVDVLPIAQATVSQHLAVLRDTGWVVGTTSGPATCYELDADTVRWFRERTAEIF
jgi:ArsR family transcriptional regulator